MLKLFVLRHGKAITPEKDLNDYDRRLNKKGTAQINQIGFILKNRGVRIDQIISSKARRTFETTSIINHFLTCEKVEYDKDLYLCSGRNIFEHISQNALGEVLLYVGHNNGISDFVNDLCNENMVLSTGMLVEINLELDDWRALAAGTGSIIETISPEVLTF